MLGRWTEAATIVCNDEEDKTSVIEGYRHDTIYLNLT